MKLKRIEAALLCAVLVASLCSVTSFASSCAQIRESVLRLHVLANSDSDADQALKLQVRDAVLEEGAHIFDGSLTADEAEQAIEQALPRLEQAARSEVMKRGYTYEVHITVSEEYFDTRTYEDEVTLPAGRYRAVRVIIGNGEGHNWWCVMFPPMCLPAAQGGVELDGVLDGKEEKIVRTSPKYEPRFKIVEWIERLREYLRDEPEEDGNVWFYQYRKRKRAVAKSFAAAPPVLFFSGFVPSIKSLPYCIHFQREPHWQSGQRTPARAGDTAGCQVYSPLRRTQAQ